MKTRRRTNRAA